MKLDLSSLPALIKIAEMAQAAVAAVVAAVRKGHPDLNTVTDEQLIRRLVDDATTGQANADALIDRLRAG